MIISETDDDEDDSEETEPHQLDRLSSHGIDQCNCDPVPWNGASADDDQIADGRVVENFVHVCALGVANGLENDGVVEAKAVKGNVEEEPRASSTDEDLGVPPFAVVAEKITPAGLWRLETFIGDLESGDSADFVGVTL